MAEQDQIQSIQLRGIERAAADTIIKDGALEQCIGLETKNGSWTPLAPLYKNGIYPDDCVKIKVHKTSTQDNIIYLDNNQKLHWMTYQQFCQGYTDWHTLPLSPVTEFEMMGNLIATQKLQYAIWSKNTYKQMNAEVQQKELPRISLRVSDNTIWTEDPTTNVIGNGNTIYNMVRMKVPAGATPPSDTTIRETIAAKALACKSQLEQLGGLTGYYLAIIAYRLTNGDYVKAGSPILLHEPQVKNTEGQLDRIYKESGDSGGFDYFYKDDVFLFPREWRGDDNSYNYFGNIPANPKDYPGSVPPAFENAYNFVNYNNEYTDFILLDKRGDNQNEFYSNAPTLFGLHIQPDDDDNFSVYRYYGALMRAHKLQIKIHETINQDLNNIIDSVCVFLSANVSAYKTEPASLIKGVRFTPNDNTLAEQYKFNRNSDEDIVKNLKEQHIFYKVHEIPFNEIITTDWTDVNLKGKLGDNLRLQPTLSLEAFQQNNITDSKLYVYNNRLHLFDYSQTKSNINDLRTYIYSEGVGQYADEDLYYLSSIFWRCIVKCHSTSLGEYTVDSSGSYQDRYFALNPIFTIPNEDAYEVTIRLQIHSGSQPVRNSFYTISLPLSKWTGMGMAIHVRDSLIPYRLNQFTEVQIENPIEWRNAAVNKSVRYNNHVKVSDVSYPYFPLSQTYIIGKSTIINLASFIAPLAQDNFGRTPVMCFTQDGIFALNPDESGESAYKTVSPPYSQEVALSRSTILTLDGQIIFASQRGLMQLTNNGCAEWNPYFIGPVLHLPTQANQKTHGTGLSLLGQVITHPQLFGDATNLFDNNYALLNQHDFLTDLTQDNTTLQYVHEKNHIIIYNKNWEYCYWINTKNQQMSILPLAIIDNDGNMPHIAFFDKNKTMCAFSQHFNQSVRCLFQTRPIKLNDGFKSITRIILRGLFIGENETNSPYGNCAGLYALASYDGEHWFPIGRKEKTLSQFHDIGCLTDRVSAKYLMVAFAGKLKDGSHIESIDIAFKNKYNNKLK